ncbi:MAG: hypothetical protein R3E39_21855 [Anaerolineae bacterium]
MFKKLFVLALLVVMLLSVTAVFADTGVISVPTKTYGDIGFINDGRLNGADLSAPVAVFYKYDKVTVPSDKPWKYAFKEEKVLRGLEMLAIDPKTGNGTLVFSMTADEMAKVIDKAKNAEGTLVGSQNGYNLYYSASNWFWITTPPGRDGKSYTYQWQNATIVHD